MLYNQSVKFGLYEFQSTLPHAFASSAFDIAVGDSDAEVVHTNGGTGFPLSDGLVVYNEKSCFKWAGKDDFFTFNVTVMVRIIRLCFGTLPAMPVAVHCENCM